MAFAHGCAFASHRLSAVIKVKHFALIITG
jgi:hypothetical protein